MNHPDMLLARRYFLGRLTLTVGGVALAGLAPASLLEASTGCSVVALAASDPCGDWTVDDMCGAYPPYAFRTGASPPHSRPVSLAVAGADWQWVA